MLSNKCVTLCCDEQLVEKMLGADAVGWLLGCLGGSMR